MRLRGLTFAAHFVVSAVSISYGQTIESISTVTELTADNFQTFLNENDLVVAYFFDSKSFSQKHLRTFYEAADILQGKQEQIQIKMAQVNCETEKQLCIDHKISFFYPQFRIIRNGDMNDSESLNTKLNSSSIVQSIIEHKLPLIKMFAQYNELINSMKEQTTPFAVLINPDDDGKLHGQFKDASRRRFGQNAFYEVKDKEHIKKLNEIVSADLSDKKTSIMVIHPNEFDDAKEVLLETGEFIELLYKIREATVPPFAIVKEANFDDDAFASLFLVPSGIYIHNNEQELNSVMKDLTLLGKQYKGKFRLYAMNATTFKQMEGILFTVYNRHMDSRIRPAFGIFDLKETLQAKQYVVNQYENPNGPSIATIESFINDYMAGNLSPSVLTEDIPTELEISQSAIVKLVSLTHDAIIQDVSKDIIVIYHGSYTNQKLRAVWNQLAVLFESNRPDSQVIVAQINRFENPITNIPSSLRIIGSIDDVFLYPANGEIDEQTGLRKPVPYDGKIKLDLLLTFIKEKGGLGIDGKALQSNLDKLKWFLCWQFWYGDQASLSWGFIITVIAVSLGVRFWSSIVKFWSLVVSLWNSVIKFRDSEPRYDTIRLS